MVNTLAINSKKNIDRGRTTINEEFALHTPQKEKEAKITRIQFFMRSALLWSWYV